MITSPPSIRISDVADLVETIPFLLGFHPAESMVVIGFNGRPPDSESALQRVSVTMRVDLPVRRDEPEVLVPMTRALVQSATESVVLVVASETLTPDPRTNSEWRKLLGTVGSACAGLGIVVSDLLLVSSSRWWSLMCDDPACCPSEGTARQRESSSAAASATFAGLVARTDRAALDESLAGDDPLLRAGLEPDLLAAADRIATAAKRNRLTRLRRTDTTALLAAADDAAPLTRRRLARFGCALADLQIRDAVWAQIDDGSVDLSGVLDQLHRRLPSPFDAPPMFLYGWHQWRAGNGTLAAMAADRALASDPGYTAATLLLDAVRSGLDPHRTPTLSAGGVFDAETESGGDGSGETESGETESGGDGSGGDGDEDVLGDVVEG